MVNFFIFI